MSVVGVVTVVIVGRCWGRSGTAVCSAEAADGLAATILVAFHAAFAIICAVAAGFRWGKSFMPLVEAA